MLTALLMQAAIVPAFAATKAEKEAKRAEKVRTEFAKLGTGKDARVKLELRDKTKVEGYLSEATEDHVAVIDADGKTTVVTYPQVRKAQGNNLSTGAKIGIGAAIGAAIVLLVIYSMYAANER
jgi:VIT1/CCC1 family predicted Fe2+/Mn2+ transporter